MITLLKKGDRHVWKDIDNYRPVTLLNTELKILVWVLTNILQIVASNLIETELNYAVTGSSVPNNLYLECKIIEVDK